MSSTATPFNHVEFVLKAGCGMLIEQYSIHVASFALGLDLDLRKSMHLGSRFQSSWWTWLSKSLVIVSGSGFVALLMSAVRVKIFRAGPEWYPLAFAWVSFGSWRIPAPMSTGWYRSAKGCECVSV